MLLALFEYIINQEEWTFPKQNCYSLNWIFLALSHEYVLLNYKIYNPSYLSMISTLLSGDLLYFQYYTYLPSFT